MSILNNLYGTNNSPFNNFVRNNYVPQTPQNRLQIAYNQAMQKKSPNWTYTVADMMPSIAEIVAAGTTKNSFNQGRIADSLEREKDRRTAYNQMMRENEENQANDYVQMAKDQLAMDMAQDEKEYKRAIDQVQRDERLEAQKRAYEQYLEQQRIAEEQRQIDNDIKEREIRIKEAIANNKPTELTPEEKLNQKLKEDEATANAKAKREAQQDLNKTQAEYNSFKSQLSELNDLTKNSGNTFTRAFSLLSNPLTGGKQNLTANELKSKVLQALYTAKGYDTDKINPQTSKDLLKQVGMPTSGYPTQSQMEIIIRNIDNIYKQRVEAQKSYLNSFDNNSVSWE